jgi:predicted O-methyltransferase YrrM
MDFRFPHDVGGWLTEAEGRKLAELARGKKVLEIGSFEGRSTICMAQAAEEVDCIDPFDARSTLVNPQNTLSRFLDNLEAYRVGGVHYYVGTTADVAPRMKPGYDLVFIDGDHSAAALAVDVEHALRLVKPDGLLAFHDYRSRNDPDVAPAVHALLDRGAELVEVVDSMAVVRPNGVAATAAVPAKPLVALAMPHRGGWVALGAAHGYALWPTRGGCEVVRAHCDSSLLDHGFNQLWCAALNMKARGVTHFAMIHADVCPEEGWLDVLLGEMAARHADVVSAVIPIKDGSGLTSTAAEGPDPWNPRKLSLREAYDLPETFGSEDVGSPLLLNTGLWVCDLRRPWVYDPEPLCFQTSCRIVRSADGTYRAQARPEDWEFSRAARARGARLFATRKVSLAHAGEWDFTNDAPAGEPVPSEEALAAGG